SVAYATRSLPWPLNTIGATGAAAVVVVALASPAPVSATAPSPPLLHAAATTSAAASTARGPSTRPRLALGPPCCCVAHERGPRAGRPWPGAGGTGVTVPPVGAGGRRRWCRRGDRIPRRSGAGPTGRPRRAR